MCIPRRGDIWYILHTKRRKKLSRCTGMVELNSSIWSWKKKESIIHICMSSESSSSDIILRENYVLRTRVCFGRFTHLPEITQISWRRFRMGIMINACSAKPHTSLALHSRYIILARPDEFFRFTVVSYLRNSDVKNRDAHRYLNRIYMIHFWWPIPNETYTIPWINKLDKQVRLDMSSERNCTA